MSCGIISQMLGIGWKIMMANKVAALVWTRGAALVASLVVIVAAAGEALRVAMGAAKTMRLAQTIVNTIGHLRVMIATLGKLEEQFVTGVFVSNLVDWQLGTLFQNPWQFENQWLGYVCGNQPI